MSRAFATAYLAAEAGARAFFASDFRDATARVTHTRAAAARRIDPALLDVLRVQQAALASSAARAANLDALAEGGTAVVVTGQQVGLFLGPLYSLYKAASAVAVAHALEAEAGVRCVPLFWLQTEDHDLVEIASATVADRHGVPTRLSLAAEPPSEARVSIAHRCLGPEVGPLLEELGELLPPGVAADETMALLRAHYVAGRPLAAAFAGVLGTLFADHGLLVLDPRQPAVAALAAPLYRHALRGTADIEGTLVARGRELAAAGFQQQIPVRERCALVFFHSGDARGPRYRLQHDGAPGDGDCVWALAGGGETVSAQALEQTLDTDPLRLSTSALLRPIVQDALLPTAAYVAGPGELNYLAQLAPVYRHFDVTPALAIPRARFRCSVARTRRLLSDLGLTADEVTMPERVLQARLAERAVAAPPNAGAAPAVTPAALGARVSGALLPAVDELIAAVVAAEPQLGKAAERTRGSVTHALGRLLDRYTHAVVQRDTVSRERLARVRAALAPDGVPQERAYSWPSLAARIGPAAFTSLVMESLSTDPFATALRDLAP